MSGSEEIEKITKTLLRIEKDIALLVLVGKNFPCIAKNVIPPGFLHKM